MNINKLCIALIFLFAVAGISSSWAANSQSQDTSGAWIQETNSSAFIKGLTVVIHIHIKNNSNHQQFFKISQQYYGTTPAVNWTVVNTNPGAVKMIKYINTGGDLGWELDPGQERSICFTLRAKGPLGNIPAYIQQSGSTPNQFWPVISEPGLAASWFMPNEIEFLNPNLDLELWQGTFSFFLTNVDKKSPRVEGIVRAPIVPVDSKLTASSPKVDFIDKEVPWANTAAWDVTLFPGKTKFFTYTYQWPISSPNEPLHTGSSLTSFPRTTATKTPASVPTKQTGLPYGLLVIGAVIIGSGIAYAKFFR
jgi:hypothetical protein